MTKYTNTEKIAISELVKTLSYNGYLSSEMKDGDRTPLQDGHICIYNKKDHSNENYYGEVIVQVKGKNVDSRDYDKKYDIERKYLNYFRKYGGIFFVVFLNRNDKEEDIYYKSLTQANCKVLLDSMTESQGTKRVELDRFPDDEMEQVSLLRSIETDSRLQGNAIIDQAFYLDDIKSNINVADYDITTYAHTSNPKKHEFDLYREISKSKNHFYLKPRGIGPAIAMQPTMERSLFIQNEFPIKVNNECFFTDAKLMFKEGDEYIYVSKNINIPVTSTPKEAKSVKMDIVFDDNSMLREKEISFYLAAIEAKHYYASNIYMDFDVSIEDDQLNNMKNDLKFIQKINKALQKHNIDKGVSSSKLNEEDYIISEAIIEGKIDSKNIKINGSDEDGLGLVLFTIGDIEILTFIYRDSDNEYFNVNDIHSPDLIVKTPEKDTISIYSFLEKSHLIADNLCSELISSVMIKEFNYDNKTILFNYNQFLLRMIEYYDDNNGEIDKGIINLMSDISKLLSSHNETIYVLNDIQIKKRLGVLNSNDRDKLLEISKSNDSQIQFGAAVILEDKKLADKAFSSMDPECKSEYKTYPIYNLYKKL